MKHVKSIQISLNGRSPVNEAEKVDYHPDISEGPVSDRRAFHLLCSLTSQLLIISSV